jgi:hypothetical protein
LEKRFLFGKAEKANRLIRSLGEEDVCLVCASSINIFIDVSDDGRGITREIQSPE